MSKHFLSMAIIFFSVAILNGCGGTGSNQNVGDNADAKAIADYEAEAKKKAEAMSSNKPGN